MTCLTGGIMFAFYTTDTRQIKNTWYNRPELKPFPAMVPFDHMDVTQRTSMEAHLGSYRREKAKQERKKSSWYRLFFPNDADYNVKENPFAINNKENVYNPNNGYYGSIHNHYRDHTND